MSYIKLFKNCLTWKKKKQNVGSVYSINVDAPFKKRRKKRETARHGITQP